MFLRRYSRTVAGKKLIYYALVESVRSDAGPRQRVIAHLGELSHDQERRWQRTVVFHNRQGEARQLQLFPDDSSVPLPDDPTSSASSSTPSAGRMPVASATCGWPAGCGVT